MENLTASQLVFRELMERVIYNEAHPVRGTTCPDDDLDTEHERYHCLHKNIQDICLRCDVTEDQEGIFTLDQTCKALDIIDLLIHNINPIT